MKRLKELHTSWLMTLVALTMFCLYFFEQFPIVLPRLAKLLDLLAKSLTLGLVVCLPIVRLGRLLFLVATTIAARTPLLHVSKTRRSFRLFFRSKTFLFLLMFKQRVLFLRTLPLLTNELNDPFDLYDSL